MIGRKTLGEIRAELEAALRSRLAEPAELLPAPPGHAEVLESLRRFLGDASAAAKRASRPTPNPAVPPDDGPAGRPRPRSRRRGRVAGS